MKKITSIAILSILLLGIGSALKAQNDQDAMMKAWMAYMTPGEMHNMLAKSSGEWTTELSMWMDPQGPPTTSKGTCTNKMILGGRYQETRFKGNFMGQPMEGIGTMGYDNVKKLFEGTWIDNMGSGIMKSTGTYDPATKTLTSTGTQIDATTGKECSFRETYKYIDSNNELMEMFVTPEGGQEYKSMEIKFKRKK